MRARLSQHRLGRKEAPSRVLRAARRVEQRRPEIQHFISETLGGAFVFYRFDEVMSYAMARLKADFVWHTSTGEQLRARLAGPNHELIVPGGAWWRFVQTFIAKRDGDHDRAAKLEAERQADLASILGGLRENLARTKIG